MFLDSVPQAMCLFFLLLVSAPPVGEAGLEACAGFLMGGASACPLVRGIGSWPSGGRGCVKERV